MAYPRPGPPVPRSRQRASEVLRPAWSTPPIRLTPPMSLLTNGRLRERSRLLAEDSHDATWLTALEARMAEAGVADGASIAPAPSPNSPPRSTNGAIAPFPARKSRSPGVWENLAAVGPSRAMRLRGSARQAPWRTSRPRDRAAGRALEGPHRGDLTVRHLAKNRPAAECSTGEQKALVLNLVLAQAARLCRVKSAPTPVVLLDEVAAHLDADRRAALFDEIEALGVQAFLTGTDEDAFRNAERSRDRGPRGRRRFDRNGMTR